MVPTSCVHLRKMIGGDLGKRKSSAPAMNRGCRAGSPHVWTSAWPWGDRALALVPGQTLWSELPGRGSAGAEARAAPSQQQLLSNGLGSTRQQNTQVCRAQRMLPCKTQLTIRPMLHKPDKIPALSTL